MSWHGDVETYAVGNREILNVSRPGIEFAEQVHCTRGELLETAVRSWARATARSVVDGEDAGPEPDRRGGAGRSDGVEIPLTLVATSSMAASELAVKRNKSRSPSPRTCSMTRPSFRSFRRSCER